METQKLWKAAIYIRISKENGDDTLENQKSIVVDYLNEFNDIQICSIKTDDGYSGLNCARPAFQEMLQDIQSGSINCVVVRDLSRLSRNYIDAGSYIKTIFPSLGVRFISVLEGLDITDKMEDNPFLLVSVKNIINEEYLRQISKSTKGSLQNGYLEGKYMGASPVYGYRRSSIDRHKLEVEHSAAEVVKDIFKWKLEGMSAAGIANKLNQSGVLSPEEYRKSNLSEPVKGIEKKNLNKWSPNTIIRILSNRVYVGRLEQGKTEKPYFKAFHRLVKPENKWYCVENAHQPIIDQQVYEAVDRLLKMDTRIPPGKNKTIVYAGFVRCGNCGQNMTRRQIIQGSHKYHYYVCCSRNKKPHKCADYRISKPVLEQEIFNQIENHINEVLYIRDMIPKIDIDVIQEACLKKDLKTVNVLIVHLYKYQKLLRSLDNKSTDEILTEAEQVDLRYHYMEKCRCIEKCIDSVRERANVALSVSCFFNWIDLYMSFVPFETVTRPLLAFLVQKIIIDKNKGVHVIFLHESKLRLLRPYVGKFKRE